MPDIEIIFLKNSRFIYSGFYLDIEELKAINEKVKELGWNE